MLSRADKTDILTCMEARTPDTSPDNPAGQSLHHRILQDVQDKILSGAWPPGHRIPFETEMARAYGCSRMTVNKALTQLTRAGLLVRNRKAGTFVNAPSALSAAMEITEISAEVAEAGKSYGYRLLDDLRPPRPPAHLDRLKGPDGARAFRHVRLLSCLHLADGRPFCLEERVISLDAVPEVASASFTDTAPGAWLLKTVPWNAAEHRISAQNADAALAGQLQIASGDAVLVIERTTHNDKGYVTWARLSYPGSQHRVCARFTPAG